MMVTPSANTEGDSEVASWASLLSDRAFLRLWAAMTAARLATWSLPFVLGFAVVDDRLTSSALGGLLAARTVGFLVAVPVGGVLADRWSRRAVAVASSAAAAAATPVVAAGLGRWPLVAAGAAAVVGAGQGASRPAFQALVADVVDGPRRPRANAAITMAVEGTVLVAPGATALASVVVGAPALVVGTGLGWLVAAAAVPPGRPSPPPSSPSPPAAMPPAPRSPVAALAGDLADGLREMRRHPWYVAGLLALTTVIATGYSVTGVLLPAVSEERYGDDTLLTWSTTALTAGALVGSLLAPWPRRRPGWVALGGLACYGLAPAALMVPGHWGVAAAAYGVTGLGFSAFHVRWFTAEQREVERSLLARVSSLSFLLAYGLAPVGLAAIGPAVDAVGTRTVLAACALACALAPAVAALVPSSRDFSCRPGTGGAPGPTLGHGRQRAGTPERHVG